MKQYSSEEKEMWIEDWRASGKSAWTYAKENGLTPQTFVNWTKRKEEPFVEMLPQVVERAARAPEIIIEKGNLRIRVSAGFERKELETVIRALGE